MYMGARNSAEPCQATYHSGDRWFIYGFLKKDGKLYFTDCRRSTTLDAAGTELRYARGEPPTEEDLMPRSEKSRLDNEPELKENGATLSGTIRRSDRAGMGRAMLTIWRIDEEDPKERPGQIWQDANADGTFVVRYLWPGTYFLSARAVDWEKPSFFVGRTETFTVKERQSLSNLEIILNAEPLAEVRIHIEPSKALHDQVEAELWDVDNDAEAENPKLYPDNQSAEPDSSGLAVLKGLQYANLSRLHLEFCHQRYWLSCSRPPATRPTTNSWSNSTNPSSKSPFISNAKGSDPRSGTPAITHHTILVVDLKPPKWRQ